MSETWPLPYEYSQLVVRRISKTKIPERNAKFQKGQPISAMEVKHKESEHLGED